MTFSSPTYLSPISDVGCRISPTLRSMSMPTYGGLLMVYKLNYLVDCLDGFIDDLENGMKDGEMDCSCL